MAQTKILYLLTQSEWGGAQRYIFDLASNLSGQGYEIYVAAGGNQELFEKFKNSAVRCYPLKYLVREINPIKDLLAYFEVKQLLKKLCPDILHLNSSKAGVLGAIAGRRQGIKKIIYTVHGFVFNEPMPAIKKMIYLWAEKFSSRFKDKLICVSEFDRQTGLGHKIVPPNKSVTIHNGLEKISFLDRQVARLRLNLAASKTVIGTIANFYPTKGLNYLIAAAALFKQQQPEILFTVIGDGQQKELLKSLIKKFDLSNNFLLLGNKTDAARYLQAFDVYVCSSVKEGFPYSVLEAMAAGRPIVASRVGGIPEMIEDNKSGLLVEPADIGALAKAIIELVKNKNLAERLSRQAQIDVTEKFNLVKMLQETLKYYEES